MRLTLIIVLIFFFLFILFFWLIRLTSPKSFLLIRFSFIIRSGLCISSFAVDRRPCLWPTLCMYLSVTCLCKTLCLWQVLENYNKGKTALLSAAKIMVSPTEVDLNPESIFMDASSTSQQLTPTVHHRRNSSVRLVHRAPLGCFQA